MKSVLFKNFTDRTFTWQWNSVSYTFKPHQEIFLEDWLAEHFAKHLIDDEINHMNIGVKDAEKQIRTNSVPVRAEIYAKIIFQQDDSEEVDQNQMTTELLNKNKPVPPHLPQPDQPSSSIKGKAPFCDTCDSKGVRHKKGCPKYTPPAPVTEAAV
jgi:hypothetical protein